MSHPTRFPSGLTNVTQANTVGNMGQPDPCKFHTYFNDFDDYLATEWIITRVGTGTSALVNGDGGILALVNTAAAIDSTSHQLVPASFTIVPGKRTFFKALVQVSSVTLSIVQLGLVITSTTPNTAAQGIFILKPAGTDAVGVFCRVNVGAGNLQNLNVGAMPASQVALGFEYDGRETVTFYINDIAVGSLPCTDLNRPVALLHVTIFVQNGDAVARTLSVDHVLAAKER